MVRAQAKKRAHCSRAGLNLGVESSSAGHMARALKIKPGSPDMQQAARYRRFGARDPGCCDERLGDAACVLVDVNQLAGTVSDRYLLRLHGFRDFSD